MWTIFRLFGHKDTVQKKQTKITGVDSVKVCELVIFTVS